MAGHLDNRPEYRGLFDPSAVILVVGLVLFVVGLSYTPLLIAGIAIVFVALVIATVESPRPGGPRAPRS